MRNFLCMIALAFTLLVPGYVLADGHKEGLVIEDAWARPSIGNTKRSAAYFLIKNMGKKDVTITSASTPTSGRTEIHTHIVEGNVMKMRELEGGLKIPAGSTAHLKPGGDHIMLMSLKAPLKEGDAFMLNLVTDTGETQQVEVKVRNKAGSLGGSHGGSHKGSHGGSHGGSHSGSHK